MITRALEGKRIVITRPGMQANELAERLRTLGAEPLLHPTIAIAPPVDLAPLDAAIQQLAHYDWVIATSANGARSLLERINTLGVDPAVLTCIKLGAVGPATAAVFTEHGFIPEFVPSEHVAEGVLAEIGVVRGQRVLLPCADIARDALAEGLRQRGALVDVAVAYRTIPGPGVVSLVPLLQERHVDAITFTSASTVRYLLEGIEEAQQLLDGVALICIGPITAQAVQEAGLHVAAEARVYTAEGLVDTLVNYFNKQ